MNTPGNRHSFRSDGFLSAIGILVAAAWVALSSWSSLAADATDAERRFALEVLPLFKSKCLPCHGDDEKKIKGGLDMRTRAALIKGGDSEQPSLIPGRPEASPLYLAVTRTREDWEAMPPKENDKLTAKQVDLLRDWIAADAPWPDEKRIAELASVASKKRSAEAGVTVKTSGGLSPEWTQRKYQPENLWAYQALKKPAVPVVAGRGSQPLQPIDAFLAARWPEGAKAAQAADRTTLLRRVTYDLIGLPPTPEEVEAFLMDPRTEPEAFAAVVERLLASPHYGEQSGQHWLDVVRYADSSGFANDYIRGNAWRYRDYVIRSFNQDKPYDQFIREQIAGDELNPSDPESLVAVGFLRMGPWELTGMEVPRIARQRFLDDATDIVGQVFLAHMLQCARCHDHKFDPVPTRDYYAMQAVFATTQLAERQAPFLASENKSGFAELEKLLSFRKREHEAALKQVNARISVEAARAWLVEHGRDPAEFDKVVAEVADSFKPEDGEEVPLDRVRKLMQRRKVHPDLIPPSKAGFEPEDYGLERIARKGLERLRWEFDALAPVALSVYDGRTPQVNSVSAPVRMPTNRLAVGELELTAILAGGDTFSPTEKVEPGILSALSEVAGFHPEFPPGIEGRRKALAEWIAQPKNPLTARVMVNRIWQGHFGRALAGNPNNFGATGKKPTHPDLLDWLAVQFIESGWSVKAIHRLILGSEAYRRSGVVRHQSSSIDTRTNGPAALNPESLISDYLLFPPRRLSAGELRDSMLQVSGELNPTPGGLPARPEINLEAALQPRQVMGTFAEAWQPAALPEQRHRRSIYVLKIRGQRDPFMEVFNEPAPDLSCEARESSTVTPQVFSLFNSQASLDRAVAFAARLKKETRGRENAIRRAFALAYGRKPGADELTASINHWDAMIVRHRALKLEQPTPPREVVREAVEENTGERFRFTEKLSGYDEFVPDLHLTDVDVETRALAEVCLVLFNSNEFAYVY